MSELSRTEVLNADTAAEVADVRRTGARSARVAEALTAAGFECDTMGGGMIEWSARGLPVRSP